MMMAVAVTIYPHANRPLPQWRYGITINGLLSIYSIVLRGCLGFVLTSCIGQLQWIWFSADRRPLYDAVLYDNAGRGPWGSLVWLWKHHIKQPLTAFGALITLISMAIDPIVQQLVAPVNCSWQASELNATLPRRNYFGYESTLPMPPADSTKLERAVALEISHPANCSGPGFLGINFVTSLHAGALNGPKILNITTPQLAQPSLDPACTSCIRNWATTPVDFNLGGMVKGTEGYSTTDTNIQLVFANTIFNSTNVNPLTGQQILNCDAATPEHDSWTCIGYGAASCTLSPCFRLYNASVTDGILSETLIDTIKLVAPSNEYPDDETINYFGLLDTQCPSPADMELLTAQNITVLGPEPQPSSRWQRFYVPGKKNATYSAWVPKNLTDPFQDDWLVPEDLWTQSCAYAIGREMALFMQKELFFKLGQNTDLSASMIGLPISVSTGIGTSDPWLDVLSSTLLTFEILGGSELMQRTYNYGNYSFALVEEIMANISESITRFMRTQEADPEYDFGAPVQGESLSAGTCLAVRWGWIAVPAAVTTCVLMLLTVIATGTAQSRLPPWKQSFLTWVFHGPRPQLHQQFQHQSGPAMQGMESASEGVPRESNRS
ncbi:hypothetical protein PFICI_02517 [Pestalotiopsis fici W106-1]|uniref:Uncharacterized protein n=1 Tax=Pestalotiopsis fici (strain W106-1 / CGMCC3.15140) TaxID=1229662 RepID=W3XGD2_PESFW|nr:uncharacterized protein PFICI_02517 [Pestalotiopsis fici W106-1]ETS84492.1 hypothetical protein PFICI_02517 [Pestalotiopsis fici W106-1]